MDQDDRSGSRPLPLFMTEHSEPPNKPSARRQIAALVAKLLSHYWIAADPVETRQAQIMDWIDDLFGFDLAIVEEACTRWRRQPGGKRPTPGDIRAICAEEQQDHRAGALPVSPEERARRAECARLRYSGLQRDGRAIVNKWARERGFADIDAYADAMGVGWLGAYRQVLAEIMAAAAPATAARSIAAELGVTAREI